MIPLVVATVAGAQPTHADVESAHWRVSGDVDHEALPAITLSRATVGGVGCYRGRATTDLPADALLDVVTDMPSHPRWSSARIVYSRILAPNEGGISYVQVIDVPFAGILRWRLFPRAGRIRDLASLMKWARTLLSRTERMRFARAYGADPALLRAAQRYQERYYP